MQFTYPDSRQVYAQAGKVEVYQDPYAYAVESEWQWEGEDDAIPEEETDDELIAEADDNEPAVARAEAPDDLEDGEIEELLGEFRERFLDETGPPVSQGLAKIINDIWRHGRDAETVKNTLKKHVRPENVQTKRVDVNKQFYTSLPKPVKNAWC